MSGRIKSSASSAAPGAAPGRICIMKFWSRATRSIRRGSWRPGKWHRRPHRVDGGRRATRSSIGQRALIFVMRLDPARLGLRQRPGGGGASLRKLRRFPRSAREEIGEGQRGIQLLYFLAQGRDLAFGLARAIVLLLPVPPLLVVGAAPAGSGLRASRRPGVAPPNEAELVVLRGIG